jgi:hypothetical protein
LVANAVNFLVRDGYIITGYGFTAEKDFMYVVDARTGETLQKLKVKSGPSYILERDGRIYARTYDHDYVFSFGDGLSRELSKPTVVDKGDKTGTTRPGEPTSPYGEVGVPECDEFIRAYAKCIDEKMPEPARKDLREALQEAADVFKEAAKIPGARSTLPKTCAEASKDVAETTAELGCEFPVF